MPDNNALKLTAPSLYHGPAVGRRSLARCSTDTRKRDAREAGGNLMRRRWPGLMRFLLGVSTFLLPGAARSQEQPNVGSPLAVGNRIRLLAPTVVSGRIEGMVIQIDETSVLVGMNDRVPMSVPRQAIAELDVRLGQKRQWRKGMIIGAAVTALSVAVLCAGDQCSSSDTGLILGLVAEGAAIGAGIGALFKADRWGPVPLDRVRVGLAPTAGRGVHFSLSLAF